MMNLNAINGCIKNAYVVSPINLVVSYYDRGASVAEWLKSLTFDHKLYTTEVGLWPIISFSDNNPNPGFS